MAINLLVNGVNYTYPTLTDEGWGPDASNWALAITQGTLQKAGGLFALTQDVDFGPTGGLKSLYYKSRSANIAAAGQIRLSNTDSIHFRNAANNGDLTFGPGSTDSTPAWNGVDLITNTGFFGFADGSVSTPSIFWENEPNSGAYRSGAGTFNFTLLGQDMGSINNPGQWILGSNAASSQHLFKCSGIINRSASNIDRTEDACFQMTLPDASSGNVQSYSVTDNNCIIIDYGIKRDTGYETGSVYIISDGTNANASYFNVNLTGPTGVTLGATCDGTNIFLTYNTSSTGFSSEIRYSARRWKF